MHIKNTYLSLLKSLAVDHLNNDWLNSAVKEVKNFKLKTKLSGKIKDKIVYFFY